MHDISSFILNNSLIAAKENKQQQQLIECFHSLHTLAKKLIKCFQNVKYYLCTHGGNLDYFTEDMTELLSDQRCNPIKPFQSLIIQTSSVKLLELFFWQEMGAYTSTVQSFWQVCYRQIKVLLKRIISYIFIPTAPTLHPGHLIHLFLLAKGESVHHGKYKSNNLCDSQMK